MTVNVTNILQAAFSCQVLCAPFMCLQFGYVIFWQKDFGAKAAHKMLVKLTLGNCDTDFFIFRQVRYFQNSKEPKILPQTRVTRRLKRKSPNFWKCGLNISQNTNKLKIQYISIQPLLNVKITTTNCFELLPMIKLKVAKWPNFAQYGHTVTDIQKPSKEKAISYFVDCLLYLSSGQIEHYRRHS
jgi:hypothetical protein